VLVETARRFVAVFYQEPMSGKRVGQAMLAGQRALKMDTFRGKVFTGELRLEDWFVPVLFQEEQDPNSSASCRPNKSSPSSLSRENRPLAGCLRAGTRVRRPQPGVADRRAASRR